MPETSSMTARAKVIAVAASGEVVECDESGGRVKIGGMAGSVGNMAPAAGIGYALQFTGRNYGPLLAVWGFAYLLALPVIHALSARLAPAAVEAAAASGS